MGRGIGFAGRKMSRPGDVPLFLYTPDTTPLHRCPALIKLGALFLTAPLAFAAEGPFLIALSAAMALACALSRPRLGEIIRLFRVVLGYGFLMAAFTLIGRPFTREIARAGLADTAKYLWRLSVVVLSGSVFYRTTSGIELRDALTAVRARVVSWFPPLGRLPDPVFSLSLTLIFIPRVFAAWTALDRAWVARGGNGSGRRNPITRAWREGRKLIILMPVLLSNLLSMAEATERALRNRTN